MRHKLLSLGILFSLLCVFTEGWAWDSGAAFYAKKSKNTPSGSGDVYIYRGGAVDKLNKPQSTDWKAVETGTSADIKLSESDKGDGKIDDNHSALNMYFFAKPRTGYDFVGWYSNENETGLMSGSTDHYDQNGKKTRWNNNSDATPPGSGYWAEEGIYYLRYVQSVKKGETAEDLKAYAKFIVKPRDIILGGTGFDEVTYTATGFASSVGKTTQTLSNASSDIALALTYDSEKYTFEGWLWAEGGFTGGDTISKSASYTYPLATTYVAKGMTSSNKVHIWPVVKRKVVPVAEVTHNAVTTPYESWGEAIAAAKATGVSGATITLYKDIADIASSQEIDRDMTLDLNGHTFAGTANYLFKVTGTGTDFTICNGSVSEGQISFSTSSVQYSYAIGVQSGSKLILQSGKVYANNTKSNGSSRGIEIQSGASLEMTGGSVEAQSLQQAYAIINRGAATISSGDLYAHTTTAATAVAYLNNGTTTEITGGTFRAYAKTTTAYGIQQNVNNTMTITNATVRAEAVTNTAYALYRSNGDIVINGGKYNAVAPATVAATNVTDKVTLKGGIYRTNTNIASCAASGYGCYELNRGETWNEGYRYEVLPTSSARNFRVVADGTSSYFKEFSDVNTFINAGNFAFIEVYLIVPEYTIPAGNYKIPSIATLVVPYDFNCTIKTTDPGHDYSAPTGPSVYRKLILAQGANITNYGEISVSATSQGGQPYGGCVHGKYGQIDMQPGSTITLKSGSNLYCWGYITGEGEITAESGSTVYEDFQIACWRGGTAASGMVSNSHKVFPLAQYYIQNIEAKTIFHAGSYEYARTAVSINSQSTATGAQIIGTTSGLFQISSGTLTKWYNSEDDRQMYQLEGNAAIGSVRISVSVIISVDIKSEEYVLPLTNNMDITIKSGTMSCNQKVALLPGAKITVCEGANVSMGSNSELYVYDKDEWGKYNYYSGSTIKGVGYLCEANYSPSLPGIHGKRTFENMTDAMVDINGTFTTASGNFYTTSSKADIYSSNGTGKVVFQAAPASKKPAAGSFTETYQVTQSGSDITYVSIPITPAQLRNADGSYLATAGTAANTTITYANGHWGWMEIWTDENNNVLYASNTAAKVNNASAKTCPVKTGYNASWTTTTTDDLQKVLHKASYTPVSYTITYNNLEGASNSSNPANYTIESANITLENPGSRTGYDFGGWFTNEELTTLASTPAIAHGSTGNKTFYAKWTLKTYAITYDKGANGTGTVTVGSKTHGVNYTLSSEKFNREGYTQTGWSTADGDAKTYDMGGTYSIDAEQTFYPFWTANEYTITYKDKDDAAFSGVHGSGYPTKHIYGTATALVNPTKAGYTFDGWYDNATCTGSALTEIGATAYTADFTLYAKWTIKSNFTITWLNYDGTTLYESTIQREGIPCYPEHLGTPKRLGDDNRTYTFKGWSPDIHAAYGDETYTAQYSMSITTGEPGAYTVSGTEDAVATTVQVSGALHVPEGKSLTTGDLIVEAYPDGSGTIDGLERVTVTGNAYFDYNFNTDPWHWSAFGVPFEIDLKAAAPLKEKSDSMTLGSDYDIVYYDSQERAAHGPSGKCWKYVENDAEHKLTPGKLYMIAFNRPVGRVNVVRFTKASTASINYDGKLDLVITSDAAGNNKNWNGIANPRMYHALLHAGVTECQVHDGGEIGKDGYYTYDMQDKKFFVGKAAFVQVPNEQNEMTTTQATDQNAIVRNNAPRRAKAQEGADRYDVQIAPMAEEMSDRVFLLTDEDKADEYVIVSDLAKAGVSPVRPQMWVNRYGVKLCKNTIAMRNNVADYPLGISVPADGSYDIFLEERPNNDDMLYLTYDGEAIWNLSYGACTIDLQRGTTDHYGLRVVAKSPQVATGIEEATIQNGDAVRKVIVEDKVFIIRNGQIFGIDGRLAK